MNEQNKSLEEAVEKHINEALFKWSYDDEDGIEQHVHDAFIAGAEWQKEQSKKNISWYSVNEFLPPVDEEVIVLTNEMNGHILPDAGHLCFAHLVDRRYVMDYNGWNIPGVKYWMYCPELESLK